MKCVFWKRDGRSPAEEDIRKELKKAHQSVRIFKRRLKTFRRRTRDQMYSSGEIKPVKGSSCKLQEWSFDLHKTTARIFFVIHQECAHFLHFFVKKSTSGISTPQCEIQTADDHAGEFWDQTKNR